MCGRSSPSPTILTFVPVDEDMRHQAATATNLSMKRTLRIRSPWLAVKIPGGMFLRLAVDPLQWQLRDAEDDAAPEISSGNSCRKCPLPPCSTRYLTDP